MMDTLTNFPHDITFVDLFERQVLLTPENFAVEFEGEAIRYCELNRCANQMANFLQSKGCGEGTIIALKLDRSPKMLISLLAIMKSGAAYMPIDPAYPSDRISYLITDSGADLILTETSADTLDSGDITKVNLDHDWPVIVQSNETFISRISNSDLAYLLYTSGSTGKPKGVQVEHGNLSNFLLSMKNNPGMTAEDRMLAITTISFDIAGLELFLPLICGAVIVLASRDTAKDGASLVDLICKKNITIAQATPATWYMLIESGWNSQLNLKALCGGEALPRDLAVKLLGLTTEIWNMYGPTETTIWSSIKQIKSADDITIGNPIDHTNIYILDADLKEVQPGKTGEIFIGGKGVSRGYLNRDELTKTKFITGPFADCSQIIYQTGDEGKQLPNGEYICLGRLDEQVKLRGFRIELGEIENVLLELDYIEKAVVVAFDRSGIKQLIAYVIATTPIEKEALISFLSTKLPEYMIPNRFVEVTQFPLTPNGKIDKKNLADPATARSAAYINVESDVKALIVKAWGKVLKLDAVGIQDNFFELGGNSLLAQKLSSMLLRDGLALPVTKLYQYPTIAQMDAFLIGKPTTHPRNTQNSKFGPSKDIAVISMSGRFPGSDSVEELWENLKLGKEGIRFFSHEEIDATIPESASSNPNYVKARGILNSAEQFDPAFFGMNLKTAEFMDPQHRIFLEICWEALEKGGLTKDSERYTIGVFAGASHNSYYTHNLLTNPDAIDSIGELQVLTLNDKDYLSSRIAYSFNLTGPAVTVQSACSTSLLAISQAVNSIRSGHCDLALAGGVAINPPFHRGHIYHDGAMFSKDGHTNAFDSNAHGTVFSDGAGVVLLKALELAESDGDIIFAVIKGIGVNNDGSDKGSFTAPNSDGQSEAITLALRDAQLEASSISFLEAHGTGTPLGDPIEIEGLKLAFGHQSKKHFCSIGSIKSNIGHLTAAAGVAGFIKTCLSLYHRQIPGSINFRKENPLLELKESPFYINESLKDWQSETVRRAGVSSFGVGGTNVHVVLEEHIRPMTAPSVLRPFELVRWSAKSASSLTGYAERLAAFADQNSTSSLVDLAFTLNQKSDFRFRNFVVASDMDNLSTQLDRLHNQGADYIAMDHSNSPIAFVFPGQGAQYTQMGRELYQNEAVFRNAVDECAALLEVEIAEDIRRILYRETSDERSGEHLNNTYYTQPAIFITGYALAKTWMHLGVKPSILIGHSIGEFVAAHLAGVFSLKDALYLIASRAKLMVGVANGSMLAVRINTKLLKPILPTELSIAAINSPNLSVVAGNKTEVAHFASTLEARGIASKYLPTSHAFHSHMMDPIVEPFENVVKTVSLNAPTIPIISTVTGTWMSDSEATDPSYWAKHLREPVKFSPAVETLMAMEKPTVILESGPGSLSCTLIRQHSNRKDIMTVASLVSTAGKNEYHSFMAALGRLWLHSVRIDFDKLYADRPSKILASVPTYAFERKSCWVKPGIMRANPSNIGSFPISFTASPETKTNTLVTPNDMKQQTIRQISEVLENASGIDINGLDPESSFLELGLDSLSLTQVAFTLRKKFNLPLTFRQLMEEYSTVAALADYLIKNQPSSPPEQKCIGTSKAAHESEITAVTSESRFTETTALNLITQQVQLLSQQIALLQGGTKPEPIEASDNMPTGKAIKNDDLSEEEANELKKPFGATAKIDRHPRCLSDRQEEFLTNLIERYNEKTKLSKQYTQNYRAIMADPRVVSGFRPETKELVYPIVANKSKGSYIWDLDGNRYIDMLNGFGSTLLGYQPDFIKAALMEQIEKGYEVGPQHVLAGEVSKLICEFTNHERAALCNTGSEAVLGAMRIARSITGRPLIVAFTGSYHGIIDEVLVRGSKKLKTFPAASGIMPEAVQNMLILDYGTDESLRIIEEHAGEIAAVLVEPVQSRRPEFQPIEFLKSLRSLTSAQNIALIFDEVITGFRMHPGGAQALFGIQADLATYGKVVGGGISIGIIAGKRNYMDALDGGHWRYGDNTAPEVGLTYFAGTFVRHPLALATAKATLLYMKSQGPVLQERITEKAKYLTDRLQHIFTSYRVPIYVTRFGSMLKIKFKEEYPYQELLFTLLREKNIHILDGFPCFLTDSHTAEELETVVQKVEESVRELIAAEFISTEAKDEELWLPKGDRSFENPPIQGALLGKDAEGNPAWFLPDRNVPGSYVQLTH